MSKYGFSCCRSNLQSRFDSLECSLLSQIDSRMVSLVLSRLGHLLCSPSGAAGAALSQQSCITLLIALAKLSMPIPRELHLVLLRSVSHYLDVSVGSRIWAYFTFSPLPER